MNRRCDRWTIDHFPTNRIKFHSKVNRFVETGMFIKIFVSFPTSQYAILSRDHDKRVAGSHGIEPRDRKVPLGCFTSDHSKARSLSCILPRVFGSFVLGFLFPSRNSFGQSNTHIRRLNQRGRTSRRFILLIPSLPRFHLRHHRMLTVLPW